MKAKIKELVRIVLMLTGIGLANGTWATLSPGDTVPGLSNTGTANTTSKYSECCFSFCIPATSDLPEGAIVKVKKIKFAEVATHGSNENNPYYLALNTCKSDAVVVDSSNKIQANDSTSCNTLIYTFTQKDCLIKVGTTYTQLGAEGAYNNQRFDAGKGLTFLHSNGNRWSSGTMMQCAVTYVNTSDANSVIASTSSSGAGYYPVYEIEAEVVTADPLAPDFEYNATVGSVSVTTVSANWVGDLTNKETNRCRIGPSGAGLVYDMGGTSTPYGNMSAKSGQFSFAVYADVAQVPSTGKKRVLVSFSKKNCTKLVLYREGDNLKFGLFDNQNAGIGAHATLPVPSAGFHLIAGVCDLSTATVSLYVDSSSDTQSQGSSYTLSNGFQLSAIYENDTAYDKGENFALSKFMGYDRALTAEEIATLSSRYPATDGTEITADINPSISDKTLTVYSSEATGSQYLGITAGTLTIPANNTVTVPQMRVMNTGAVTVNINGTVEIDSSMDSLPATGEAFISGYKGILFGGADAFATGTYNITGTIDASDAYWWTTYQGDDQTINIDGGVVSVKAIRDDARYLSGLATINLTGGGVLEVGEIITGYVQNPGYRNFGNGIYRVLSTGTENRAIAFGAGSGEYTTLDSHGNTLTIPASGYWGVQNSYPFTKTAVTGSGDIKVASSVSGGTVKFNSLTADYTGNITVAANSTMELVAGAYAGTITVETGGTLEINPGSGVDYTCSATITGAGSVAIKSGNVTLATAPTVTSAISVDSGAKLILPTGTVAGVSGSGELNIPNNVVVTVTTANAITVGSLTGTGTLLMSGIGPGSSNTTLQNLLKNGNWDGTFAIANVTRTDSNGLKAMDLHLWGNAGSKLKLIGVKGYFNRTTTAEQVAAQPELVLENGTGDYAYGYKVDDGWSYTISGNRNDASYAIIRKLSGTGKLLDDCNPSQLYVINDASDFSGSIEQGTRGSPYGKTFVFSPSITPSTLPENGTTTSFDGTKATAGTIDVRSDATIAMANGSTWQSQNGIRIAGEVVLKGSATMSSPVIMVADAKLTFKAGAVLNAISVALPASGTVAVDVSAIADSITSSGVTLITSTGNIDSETDISALTVTSGYFLKAETDVLKVYPLAATVNDANTGDVLQSFATVGEALTYAGAGLTPYARYVVVMADATVESSVTSVLIDADGVTLNLTYSGLEYQYSSSPTGVGNIYYYQKVDKAADYTWDEDAADNQWGTAASWVVGGDTATRPPRNAGDTATFESDETVTLSAAITIKELNIASAVMLTATWAAIDGRESVNFSVTDGISLTSAGASLTVRSVNLSTTPTTDVEGCYVKETTGSGTTTYTVTAIAASVTDSGSNVTYYDSLATAVSSASTGDSIALFANSSEAITLNDKTINFSEGSYTFTGTFTGNGTVVLGAALKSASSDRWPVGWTGTVELKGITSVIADFNFAHYGNANSTVKANNVLIRLNPEATGTDVGGVGAIEVASGGLKFGGTRIVDKIFYISATITGSGAISVGTPGGEVDDTAHKATCTKYVFSGDYSAFRGAVNFSGASSYRAGIVFRNGSDTIPTQTDWGQIIVTENATLTTSGTLDGAGGFVIKGEIDLLSGGSVTTGGAKIGGDGLIVLTEGSSGALASSKFNSDKWTGVVELKNITTAIDSFDFVNYGTANSTVRANGVTVKENDGAIGNVGCIDVASGGLTFGNSSVWKNGKTISIAADITGSGLIVVATPVNAAHGYTYYVFTGDVSGFAGSVRAQSAWSPTYDSVIVFKDAEDEMPTATAYRQMFVTENASVNIGASATWTASTLTVDGTMNIASGGILSGTVKGSGKITYAAYPASAPSLDNAWSGTVALPAWTTSAAFDINAYGKVGSTIELAGMSSGWIKPPATGTVAITPNLKLTGTMSLANCSERDYSFQEISGNGTLSVSSTALNSVSITKISAGYTGTISNTSGKSLTIARVDFTTKPTVGTKVLSVSGDNITITKVSINGVDDDNISYSRNTSGAEGDGFYVNSAATTTGTGDEAVTTVTTDGSTTSVAVTLDNDYSGKIAVPANVATLTVTGPTITAGQLQLVTTQGTYDNLLSYSAGTVSLDPSAFYQNGEGEANKIYVEPKTAASDPMTMPGATTAPSFSIKTIPGLYYVVRSGTSPSSLTAGAATQATTTTTGLAGPALGNEDTVRYYKISVGRTAAEARQ